MAKFIKEWFAPVPWGNLAFISWGNPSGKPVLLVHGRQDSAATFIPLLELLPDHFHYVGFDLPGHGKSDPFPTGVMLSRIHFVTAVDQAVKHLGWDKFDYMAHSFGGELGSFYHLMRPNKITKMIFFDSAIVVNIIDHRPFNEFYKGYEQYYDNYYSMNYDNRVYNKRNALDSVMRARGLTEAQAEIVLSRNLIEIGNDQYRLSWDKRLKILSPLNIPLEQIAHILLTHKIPPVLFIGASQTHKTMKHIVVGAFAPEQIQKKHKHFFWKIIEGSHDVHLTNPERMAGDVSEFLKKDFNVAAKL